MLMKMGIPITISSDDPAWYGYSGVTHDFVYIFYAWELGLEEVKALALNSLRFATLDMEGKLKHLEVFVK